MDVVSLQHLRPKLELAPLDEVASLLLEHRVVIGDGDELIVAEALRVCNVRQVRIPGFTEFTDNKRFVELEQMVSIVVLHEQLGMRTLFSFRNCSGLLLLSM